MALNYYSIRAYLGNPPLCASRLTLTPLGIIAIPLRQIMRNVVKAELDVKTQV